MSKRIVLVMAAGVMFGLALVMTVPSGPAYAISCASGATCTEELLNNNIDSGAVIDVKVTVNNTVSGQTTITVAYISSNLTNTALGIDQFGYGSTVQATTLPSGFSYAKNCPCQMDSFGKFASEMDSPGGTLLSFSFTLPSQVTTFSANANGAEFAAHVRFGDNCSGFVSDGTPGGTTPNANCHPVAEPSALFLVGLGLVGVGYVARTRWSSRRRSE